MPRADVSKAIKVLFIEDDEVVAHLVRARIEATAGDSMEVFHERDLKSALIALSRSDFDVVLTDLNLPDSQGTRTVKRLLAMRKYIPVVALSAVDDEHSILETLQAGAQEYLVKGETDGYVIARSLRQAIHRKRTEIKLRRLAHYDSLTGLANRTLFHKRLEHALARAMRRQSGVALMLIDLDRFKTVNDTLGHAAGDRLLALTAERLRAQLRKDASIARLGGDEFTVLIEDVASSEEGAAVAERILHTISQPFELAGQQVYITPSIGITVFPYDDDNSDGLMKNADAAMYQMKASGRNGYKFFTPGMNESTAQRLKIEAGLRQAIERGEFVLHYQPKLNLQTGRLQGMEALVRWQRPGIGMVAPVDFIPIAEDTGLIIPIGEWVIRKALEQTRLWLDNGLPVPRVAVNISARQFRQGDIVQFIAGVLGETGLSGEHLEVEITESVLMEDTETSVATLKSLKQLGVRIAVDDFGTGYSSLNYLKRFPIDTLKIDRSFVSDIPGDADDAVITKAIIGLAHNLRLTVIAEGVETEEQVAFLRVQHCDEAQGYLFSGPLNTMQATGYLQRERTRGTSPQLSVIEGGNQAAV